MGQCFLYGNVAASGGLKIVTGLLEPASPKEGTVWVKSDSAAKKYVIADAAPEEANDGLIWFEASGAGILTSAWIYADGAWVRAEASIFVNGKWIQFSWGKRYLIKDGVPTVEFVANAAKHSANQSYTAAKPTIDGTVDGYYKMHIGAGKSGLVVTKEPIPLKDFKTISVLSQMTSSNGYTGMRLWKTATPTYQASDPVASVTLVYSLRQKDLSLEGVTQDALYLGFGFAAVSENALTFIAKDLWME